MIINYNISDLFLYNYIFFESTIRVGVYNVADLFLKIDITCGQDRTKILILEKLDY